MQFTNSWVCDNCSVILIKSEIGYLCPVCYLLYNFDFEFNPEIELWILITYKTKIIQIS